MGPPPAVSSKRGLFSDLTHPEELADSHMSMSMGDVATETYRERRIAAKAYRTPKEDYFMPTTALWPPVHWTAPETFGH